MKPPNGQKGRELPEPPPCWVAFFREARRIANQRRLEDARNGVRKPSALKRKARKNITDEPQAGDNSELRVP